MYQIPTKENKVKIDDAPKEVIISLISPINEFNSPSWSKNFSTPT